MALHIYWNYQGGKGITRHEWTENSRRLMYDGRIVQFGIQNMPLPDSRQQNHGDLVAEYVTTNFQTFDQWR
jgi:hypothetical protein